MKVQNRMKHNNKNHYGLGNQKRYITIHDTGNPSHGANAEMHARHIENGSEETWHYTVDDRQAIQHFSHDTQCWHAGDKRGSGNLHSIGIEICVNSDGDYKKAIENTVKLVQKLMKDLNIPFTHIVQHNHWSGKDCPKQLRNGKDGITWKNFIDKVNNHKEMSEEKLYKVQVGAFKDRKNADDLARKLQNAGFKTYIAYEGVTPAPQEKRKSVAEYADIIERTSITGVANRAKYLGLTLGEYQPVQQELNRRYK